MVKNIIKRPTINGYHLAAIAIQAVIIVLAFFLVNVF